MWASRHLVSRRLPRSARLTCPIRPFTTSRNLRDIPQYPNPPVPQPVVTPYTGNNGEQPPKRDRPTVWEKLADSPIIQAGITTAIGLIAVFAGGVGYITWYKADVLNKMEGAFAPGYDPALEVGKLDHGKHWTLRHDHVHETDSSDGPDGQHKEPLFVRQEQDLIDRIVRGEITGNYWLLMGPKGTGKKQAIIESMRAVNADGAAFAEAHEDLEVFRLRLGKGLHYEFNEDWQGSLFSRRDPREGGPRLDIERAMNKLEKVALRYAERRGRPLVLAISDLHLLPNDEEGVAMIHQLQQRAEAWAEAGILSMIFTTDDYWPFEKMKKNASRLHVINIPDLTSTEAYHALRHLRECYGERNALGRAKDEEQIPQVLHLLGGRLSFLSRVAKARDMLEEARDMLDIEREWLLARIGLIPDHDDDVMDEQKWSSCSWLLLHEFAKLYQQRLDREKEDQVPLTDVDRPMNIELPKTTYGKARVIMTRADFLNDLDHANIISIDKRFNVRPDNMLTLRSAQQVTDEEGFEKTLNDVRDRVDQIEGLHRQSELCVKEPFQIKVKGNGLLSWLGLSTGQTITVEGLGEAFVPVEEDDDDDDDKDD